MDIFLYVFAGFAVGTAIGLTGVGGGSLMTPLLLLFGFPLHVAVGTDLAYAAITKSGGMVLHIRQRSVDWRVALLLCLGSLPAAVLTILSLRHLFDSPAQYDGLISLVLGLMLIATAIVLLQRFWREARSSAPMAAAAPASPGHRSPWLTVVLGALLGALVTLSSVGAAAIATAAVLWLYPRLATLKVVGTNLAHAVPLTLVGGLGHLMLGNVDFLLLASLVAGSLPAIYLGNRVATAIPDRILNSLLASTLFAVGVKFTFF